MKRLLVALLLLIQSSPLYAADIRFPGAPTNVKLSSSILLSWTPPMADAALTMGCGGLCQYQHIAPTGYIVLRQDIHEPGSWGFLEEMGRTTNTSFPIALPASSRVCFFVVAVGGDYNSSMEGFLCYPPPETLPIAPTIRDLK